MRTAEFQEVAAVLQQYPVSLRGVRKGEGGYLVQTAEETGWLQVWTRTQRLRNFLQAQRKLHEAGSSLAVSLVRTKHRQAAVLVNRKGYTLSRWPRKSNILPEPERLDGFRQWGALLGALQQVLQDKEGASFEMIPTDLPETWIKAFQRGGKRFEALEQTWVAASPLSPEEKLFLRNMPQLKERVRLALSILASLRGIPVQTVRWSLGSQLSRSFVLTEKGQVSLAPWASFSRSFGLADVGRLLLRAMEQETAVEKVQAVLSGFEDYVSLRAVEYQVLLSYVLFPHLMWSLAKQAREVEGVAHLPVSLDELRHILISQQHYRDVYVWLNREIAVRK